MGSTPLPATKSINSPSSLANCDSQFPSHPRRPREEPQERNMGERPIDRTHYAQNPVSALQPNGEQYQNYATLPYPLAIQRYIKECHRSYAFFVGSRFLKPRWLDSAGYLRIWSAHWDLISRPNDAEKGKRWRQNGGSLRLRRITACPDQPNPAHQRAAETGNEVLDHRAVAFAEDLDRMIQEEQQKRTHGASQQKE